MLTVSGKRSPRSVIDSAESTSRRQRRCLPSVPGRVAQRSRYQQQIATNFRRSRAYMSSGHPVVTCRGWGRHRKHVQRIDAASISHALHVCRNEGRPRGICARPGTRGRDDDIRATTVIEGGTSVPTPPVADRLDWEWDTEHGAAAIDLWTKTGLISQALGRYGGQEVSAVGDVHVFVVTRPRTQKMDTVYCRSF